jgi:hypothetical protein
MVPEITAQRNADRVLTSIGLPFGVIPSPVQTGRLSFAPFSRAASVGQPGLSRARRSFARSPVTGEPYGLPLCLSRGP